MQIGRGFVKKIQRHLKEWAKSPTVVSGGGSVNVEEEE